jgi:hypothetical protein
MAEGPSIRLVELVRCLHVYGRAGRSATPVPGAVNRNHVPSMFRSPTPLFDQSQTP